MNRPVSPLALVGILALSLGATTAPKTLSVKTTDAADARVAARRFGFNYTDIRTAAMQSPAHMQAFLSLGTLPIFDGASADVFCTDLYVLLKKQGDLAFDSALLRFNTAQQRDILSLLLYDAVSPDTTHGIPVLQGKSWDGFMKQYPSLSSHILTIFPKPAARWASPPKPTRTKAATTKTVAPKTMVKQKSEPKSVVTRSAASFPLPHAI